MDSPPFFVHRNGYRKVVQAASIATWLAVAATASHGFDIELDYSYDAGSDNFFGSNPTARAAIDQAAADISALLSTELAAVQETYSGMDGSITNTYNWDYVFTNPTDGSEATISSPSLAANTVRIYVGVRELAGSTLGQGGPSGASFTLSGNGISQAALDAASAASNAGFGRGAGPVIRDLSGSNVLGNYSVNVGVGVGNLWFDVDTDNNGGKDNDATLESYWHYDHTTPTAAGKYDLYSVALHEMLHAIGIGLSNDWDDQIVSSTNWTGQAVIDAHGTGIGVIESGSGHIADGLMSPRLSDGVMQEAAMTHDISRGERREITELDAAFLVDLNYTLVPEPTSIALLGSASLLLILRRKRY